MFNLMVYYKKMYNNNHLSIFIYILIYIYICYHYVTKDGFSNNNNDYENDDIIINILKNKY